MLQMFSETTATLNWQAIPDANSYTIQYKTSLVSSWITRTANTNSINVSALTCGTGYTFKVHAVCPSGNSIEYLEHLQQVTAQEAAELCQQISLVQTLAI